MKLVVTGRLHPKAQPVDPRPANGGKELAVSALRIGLTGDLSIPCHVKTPFDLSQHGADPFAAKGAGSAPADIDRVHLPAFGGGRRLFDMGQKGLEIAVHDLLPAGQGIEVAVVTFGPAKRDMDIESQLVSHRFHLESLNGDLPDCRGMVPSAVYYFNTIPAL